MRRIQDYINRDGIAKNYPIFKGYSVKTRNKRKSTDEHYVVPWEMVHVDCKKELS